MTFLILGVFFVDSDAKQHPRAALLQVLEGVRLQSNDGVRLPAYDHVISGFVFLHK